MLTYTSRPKRPEPTHEYPWLLLLLAFFWLWPGVFSHDLWTPSEPKMMLAIDDAAQRGAWLPTVFGATYFDVSPLYVQTAAWFKMLLSPWAADAFSAARFASVLFTSLGLLGSGMAGYRFLGRHHGRSVVLILIGSVGILPIAHFLGAYSPVFAGVGLAMWGFSIAQRQVMFSAILVALGTMLLAQSLGLLAALAILLVASLLPFSPHWRNQRYTVALVAMWAISLPLLAVYPIALAIVEPAAFAVYWQHHLFGSFGGVNQVQAAFSLHYYLQHLLWFAFPALPLAIWTRTRQSFRASAAGVLVATWLAVFGGFLLLNPEQHQDLLVLLLPPLALSGAAQLDNLRRGMAAFLNWFGIALFGCAAVFLWIGFVAMNYGFPAKLAERAAYFSPYYTRDLDIMPILVALLFTPMWLIAITRKRIRGRQAVTNWAAGTTLVWALLMTLFLPWIDAAKSHRPVIQQLIQAVPDVAHANCLYIDPRDKTARLAWQQYGTGAYTIQNASCRYTLAQYNPRNEVAPAGNIVWQGKRPRSKTELFVLIQNRAE